MLVDQRRGLARWFATGEGWIWLNACAIGLVLLLALGLIGLIALRGLGAFWPGSVALVSFDAPLYGRQTLYGEPIDQEQISASRYEEATGRAAPEAASPERVQRILLKTGNRRDNPPAFRWLYDHEILAVSYPSDAVIVSRAQWGDAYGRIDQLEVGSARFQGEDPGLWPALEAELARIAALDEQLEQLQSRELTPLSETLSELAEKLDNSTDPVVQSRLMGQRQALVRHFSQAVDQRLQLMALQGGAVLRIDPGSGARLEIPLSSVVDIWRPNAMGPLGKINHYFKALGRYLSSAPRDGNTGGGVFPAIFGTLLMVLLMSLLVAPLGVAAAIYLREYAVQGPFVQFVRISVNNLAGVPSIVFGVFGLGFFVYGLGGSVDALLFGDRLPTPTFGSPGLLWAALTLALLTLPVVIVSTEEGLNRIPQAVREGSFALGATQAETLFRVLLPIASPAVLTGVILAVARGAGEVAPLMLVGVVKFAPTLPLDGTFPFLHLDRQFMHLGFHIYDLAFQSPRAETARPLVYATALLLLLIVLGLNLLAMVLRNRLEKRYKGHSL